MYSQFVIVYTSLHVRYQRWRKTAKKEWKSDLIQFYLTAFQMVFFGFFSSVIWWWRFWFPSALASVASFWLSPDFVRFSSWRFVIWICMFVNRMILRALTYRYIHSVVKNSVARANTKNRNVEDGHTERWRHFKEWWFGARLHLKSQFSSISSFQWSKQ